MDLSDSKGDHKDNSNASNGNGNANDNEVYVPPLVSSMVAKSGGGAGGLLDNITAYSSSSSSSSSNGNNNMLCPYDKETPCDRLQFPCIRCNYNHGCIYGRDLNVTCEVINNVQCLGERSFQRQMNCRYCYQTHRRRPLRKPWAPARSIHCAPGRTPRRSSAHDCHRSRRRRSGDRPAGHSRSRPGPKPVSRSVE